MSISSEDLLSIANQLPSPVYVYDKQSIVAQYGKLKKAFEKQKVRFFYACKALSNSNILKIIKAQGIGLDTVSINEVQLGLRAGFLPTEILFTPNCVSFEEIKQAVSLGVHINIDNISILEQFGNFYGGTYPIMLRFNPHIMAGGNYNISTGHIDSKFGISIHQLRHIVRIVKATQVNVEGIHMHTGSEIKDINVFLQGMEVMLEIVEHFDNIKYIDLGSGFKVPYKEDEKETDVKQLAHGIKNLLDKSVKESPKLADIELWFEPGKYLVSQSGYFIARSNVVKPTPATVFVGINTGFNHLIRPMFYNSYHKIENLSNIGGTERIYTIVGNLCETDTFAWDRVMSEVKEGDFLVFKNAGAYCFEMSMNYNSRCKPAEYLWDQGKLIQIRHAESFDDLQKNVIDVL